MESKKITAILRAMTGAGGCSGFEQEAAETAADMLKEFGETEITPAGSLICRLSEGKKGAPHLMLEAHLDRVGAIVTAIEDGFLRFAACGGLDRRLLPASPVEIETASGKYCGVIASVPPHLADPEAPPEKIEDMLIDTGFSDEKARKIFAPGDRILLSGPFAEMENGLVTAAALDNRAGCAAVIAAGELIAAQRPDCRVSLLFSSQEETKFAGAMTGTFMLEPDMAIVVDVTFGDGFGVEGHRCVRLGQGPALGIAPILDGELTALVKKAAEDCGIALQTEVMGASTGTDSDCIATTGKGVRTAMISIPLRSMHTPVETVSVEDVLNTARILAQTAREVK